MTTIEKVWTVSVLLFINLLNYMDRYTVAGVLPVLEDVKRNGFGARIDDTEGGLLQTSFVISFMLFSPIFGYLGDRCTRKYIMAIGIFLWSVFVLVGSFSVNYYMLLASRCLVGIGEASYATVAPTIIADLFTTKKRLRILALFYMAIPIGSALGFGVSAFVSDTAYDQFGVNESWRWAFRITPGLGVLAVFLILSIKEPARGQSDDPRNKKGVKGEIGFRGYYNDIKYLLKNKTFILTTCGYAALTFSVGALAQWAPTLVFRMSKLLCIWEGCKPYSNFDASVGFGVITVIAGLVGTISGSELSKFLSRWTQQSDCIVCAIGLLVGTPFLYVALVIGVYNLYAAWILVFVGELILCLNWAPVGAILLYVVVPERRSTAGAIQILIIHLFGDAASPFIIGAISDRLSSMFHKQYDDVYSSATGMQYSLYATVLICAAGGGFFLWSTLTVEKDKEAVEKYVKIVNTQNGAIEDHQSMNSDVQPKTEYSTDNDYYYNETDKLLSNQS